MAQFWGSHQRFFNALTTAMSVPSIIADIERALQAGESAVVQLVNTGEATQERRLAQAAEADLALDQIDLTPRDILMEYLHHSFPTVLYESYEDADGNTQWRVVTDSQGNVVDDPQAVARRDRLLEALASPERYPIPEGAVDQLINHFGSAQVAEVTGRKRRLVRTPKGRVEEKRGARAAEQDADDFMAGKKRILVFSDKGGTGRSYHADRRAENQQRRVHYLLQPGWRANKAMQGTGRTHRTNQANAPHYVLVSTDIKAQRRFLAAIARRLDQLGALTKGQRDTASQGLFSADMNLESVHAEAALQALWKDLRAGTLPGLDADTVAGQMGLPTAEELQRRRQGALRRNTQAQELTVPRFLNRLFSLDLVTQDRLFEAFFDRFQRQLDWARAQGTLDRGVATIRGLKVEKVEDTPVRAVEGQGETRYVKLAVTEPVYPMSYPHALEWLGAESADAFWRNQQSGRVYAFRKAAPITDAASGRLRYLAARLNALGRIDRVETERDGAPSGRYERLGQEHERRAAWEAAVAAAPKTRTLDHHLITGALLPIWDRLPPGSPQIVRTQTDEGEVLLGRVLRQKRGRPDAARPRSGRPGAEPHPGRVAGSGAQTGR